MYMKPITIMYRLQGSLDIYLQVPFTTLTSHVYRLYLR
jgi:hypothetical protein